MFKYARKKIEIFSTPFSLNDVDYLEKLNVNFYKIASADLVNLPLIKKVGRTGKPLILSTGMSNFSNTEEAVNTLRAGNQNLMTHCLSLSANELEMNLNSIKTLKQIYNIPVGYLIISLD